MTYPGGKNGSGVYHAIINEMPPHRIYIEPFLGSGAILRHKRLAETTYAVEIDPDVFTSWETRLEGKPLARSFDSHYRCDVLADPFRELLIYNTDFLTWAKTGELRRAESWRRDVLIYCDPPYLLQSRGEKARSMYKRDFSTWFEHEELLALLLKLDCNVMLSGYDHPVYNEKLRDWRRIEFPNATRGGTKTEVLWCNYAEPAELHDYRYIGRDYVERETVRKKQKRWTANLLEMPPRERFAMVDVLQRSLAADTAESGGAIVRHSIPSEEARADAWFNCIGKDGHCATHTNNASSLCDDCLREFGAASGLLSPSIVIPGGAAAAGWLGKFARQVRSGNGRKPLKADLAMEVLVDNYWSESIVETALICSDPLQYLTRHVASNPTTFAGDNFIDRLGNPWVWTSGEGGEISIWAVKKNMPSGVPFGTTVEQLARKVLDYHVAGMDDEFRADIGIMWPPQKDAKDLTAESGGASDRIFIPELFGKRELPEPTDAWHDEMVKLHAGDVHESGVFLDEKITTVTLYKKGKDYIRVKLAYSSHLDMWFWGYDFSMATHGGCGGAALPNKYRRYHSAAPTKEVAIERATASLNSKDLVRALKSASAKPRARKTPATTATAAGA
jgi:DNA adenine methylase